MKECKNYIIATVKSWNIEEANKLIIENKNLKIVLISDKRDLDYNNIKKHNPRYIMFPHWSWKIPESILENYECIIFHMTDLPFGRGGSPLQNLISRGICNTKISAVKVVNKIDAGPIYIKENLKLEGDAEYIYKKASKIIFRKMIPFIIKNEPSPEQQKGKIVVFKRRKPEEGNIQKLKSLNEVYDYIRMLDAEGYPNAFIESAHLKIEFSSAKLKNNCVVAKVKIIAKEQN
jgi:methionyl-tRNA formyltransferase